MTHNVIERFCVYCIAPVVTSVAGKVLSNNIQTQNT